MTIFAQQIPKIMKNLSIIFGIAATLLIAVSCSCNGKKADNEEPATTIEQKDTMAFNLADLPDEPVFNIVTNMGTIKVKLYSNTPKHRANFINLVKEHYYDNILFHRVINGFMIQAGDPISRDKSRTAEFGTGGPDYTVPAEFVPEYRHKKGALAAARRGDAANPLKASSGSQFYLVQDENACAQLDGDYTVFGETIEGLDVIDKIAAVQTGPRDLPVNDVKIIEITLDEGQLVKPSPDEE